MTLFFILAAIAIISAFGVIFNRNVVHSALSLLVNFCVLAVLYFTLNAQFLGIAQILVYAGAIVVLFLFVVMLLGAELGEPFSAWITWRNGIMVVLGLVLLTVIGTAVFEYSPSGARGDFTQEVVAQLGQTQAVAAALFTDYLLPFQLVAVLLSVGVVGVVWLAQHQQRQKMREVVAVLDETWPKESEYNKAQDSLRVNWLKRQEPFDFDWVDIVQADDKDVERFVTQIGNDTDDWRSSRYRQIRCHVAATSDLSENTLRVLRNMFAEVKVGPRWQDD
jgi:NADH-quinone oxidoreductase subunit J